MELKALVNSSTSWLAFKCHEAGKQKVKSPRRVGQEQLMGMLQMLLLEMDGDVV